MGLPSNRNNNQGLKRSARNKFFDVRTGREVQPSAATKKRVAAARRRAK